MTPSPNNAHGYKLDEYGQPTCQHCGKSTAAHYLQTPNMVCWSCGLPMLRDLQSAEIHHEPKIGNIASALDAALLVQRIRSLLEAWGLETENRDPDISEIDRLVSDTRICVKLECRNELKEVIGDFLLESVGIENTHDTGGKQ